MVLFSPRDTTRGLELTPDVLARSRAFETPFFLVDLGIVRQNLRALGDATGADVYYAVKANDHPEILHALADAGSGFEVASAAEMNAVLALGVPPSRIVSSNPVKLPSFIRAATASGVRRFAVDSFEELRKIEHDAPGAAVYIRVAVDNSASDWPLSRKHGAQPAEAVPLLIDAAQRGLEPIGLTFHVGSQCRDVHAWHEAMLTMADLWRVAAERGITLRTLNIGGGFPVRHTKVIPELGEIGDVVRALFAEHFPLGTELAIEPGRALVGSAAVLVTSVIGRARREDGDWLYLDAGVFNGLMEAIGGFEYQYRAERDGPTRPWTVAGPSCDSVDTMQSGVQLPDLATGERVYVMNAGAYTASYASDFNGFGKPETRFVD